MNCDVGEATERLENELCLYMRGLEAWNARDENKMLRKLESKLRNKYKFQNFEQKTLKVRYLMPFPKN